ncbi:hypothetical protein Ddc_19904 [Ditylenchus destructor]|nr:hypothetical protein Ddc_19904 [Ditylenchus destructor]
MNKISSLFIIQFLFLNASLVIADNCTSSDILNIKWPKPDQQTDPLKSYIDVDCYMELDQSFIGRNTYLLKNTKQLKDRLCLIRIPGNSEVTFKTMHFLSPDSYVRVASGSTNDYMPLSTPKIHQGDHQYQGNWHIACDTAYIIFGSKGQLQSEFVEFTLSQETEEDKTKDSNKSMCNEDGKNFASILDLDY